MKYRQLSVPQAIEVFHLCFLQVLAARLDLADYALKGGANLRYFFGSVRYSEDIDLDVSSRAAPRLGEKIDKLLTSKTLEIVLAGAGIAIEERTKPKQTETTMRWKLGLRTTGQSQLVRTRIEFSNRNGDSRRLLEAVPPEVVAPYALRPPTVSHYVDGAATEQKVEALAGRSQTQSRDVFDLEFLLRREALPAGSLGAELANAAITRALELDFAVFSDQVLPFLDSEIRELYDNEATWEEIQMYVVDSLEAAK